MKKFLYISFLMIFVSSIGYAKINTDSLIQASRIKHTAAVTKEGNEEITYPPKPPETTTEEMVAAGKGLAKETKELGKAVVGGVKDDGGIIATVKKHKKFYGSIFIFLVLFLCWTGGRRL